MDLFGQFRSVDSADGGKSSGSGSAMDRITDLLGKKISLERSTVPFSGESRYLTPLWVFGNGEPREEFHRSDSSQSTTTSFELRAEKIVPHHQEIKDKISAALKLLTFREQHVLVQFWSPHVVGKHQLLTTVDQPFGLGVVDEGLCLYRRDSERNLFVVDKDHEEDDLSPPARVFRRGLPEWTSDLTNYIPKDFPQQECAIRCNLYGYLALPVFDSTTRLCVGVLELLTSSKYMSYAYEVQQVHRALKTANLTTPRAFDCPTSNVPIERRQNELDKIFSILKVLCGIHRLPLAQTWAVSPFSSFVSHEKILEKSCSSFDTRCLGKVCLSTAALPFHVADLGMWPFWNACRERHLEKSRGFVGRALLSGGSCFCGDVTKLSEEEYPLVHNARMSRLTSCFAIFLHSVEANDDYVLEFFLPLDIKEGRYVLNLVQTLKQNIEVASGFELGDISSIEVVGPPREVSNLSLNIEPDTIQISLTPTANTKTFETVSLDSESIVANGAKTDSAIVPNQWSSKQNYPNKCGGIMTTTEKLAGDDVISDNINVVGARKNHNATSYPIVSMQKTSDTFTDAGEKSNRLKQGRKHKIDSLTMEAVKQHLGTTIGEAAKSLGVSRSTLKRFCREHDISSWPVPKHSKRTAYVTDSKLSQKSWSEQDLQGWSSNVRLGISVVVFLLVRVKRWSCSSKRHGFSGRWWICGKHSSLPSKSDFDIYQVARLMVRLRRWRNKSSLRHAMPKHSRTAYVTDSKLSQKSWSGQDLQRSSNVRLGIAVVVFLIVRVKQWSCSSKRHGFSGRWWICGKHSFLPSKSDFDIYQVARLMVRLRRWRNKSSIRHAMLDRDHPAVCLSTGKPEYTTNIVNPYLYVDWQLPDSGFVHASPKRTVANVSDMGMVTVKATFKDDTIKFRFPTSSGLLELENEVAQRIKLKSRRLRVKYRDEDDDLILIACDADLHNLLGFSASNSTIRLIIQMADD